MYSLAEMSFMFRLSSVVIGMAPVSGRSHSNRRGRVGVVAVDFEHFRDVAASWSALELKRGLERVADVARDSSVEEFDVALQREAREGGEAVLRRIGVNRFADGVIENEMFDGFQKTDS